MTTQLTNSAKVKHNSPIKITRLTEPNIVNNKSLKTSKRLAKAYSINS